MHFGLSALSVEHQKLLSGVSCGSFLRPWAHQSGKKIEQEARRRGGKRRERLILSGKYLPLLRSLRLRASCSIISSLGCPMRWTPHETLQSQTSSPPPVSASPRLLFDYFFFRLSNEMDTTRNAAEPKLPPSFAKKQRLHASTATCERIADDPRKRPHLNLELALNHVLRVPWIRWRATCVVLSPRRPRYAIYSQGTHRGHPHRSHPAERRCRSD